MLDAKTAGYTVRRFAPRDEVMNDAPIAPAAASDPWNAPDLALLGNGRRAAPEYPADLLGEFWCGWVRTRAAAACSPVDYVATSLLVCAGAALANVRRPKVGSSWNEPPVLWGSNVGAPSSGKSPAMDAAADLVAHAEDRMSVGFESQVANYQERKQVAKATREAWEAEVKAAIKAGETPPPFDESALEPAEPVMPRIITRDSTIEKLGVLAAGLPRGLLQSRDELTGWFGAFDKYGGGGSDRAFAIEQYGGRSYTIDRVKTPEPIRIRHLSIGVLGGVQPDKLSAIIEGSDDGLAARFLWSWPDALPTFRLARAPLDDSAARVAFARFIELQMATDELGHPAPVRIPCCEDAEKEIETFGADMAYKADEASGILSGAYGKARGHAIRLATVLEYLRWAASAAPEPVCISQDAMLAATALLESYYLPMAERVFGDAAIPVKERRAMALARHLRREQVAEFNARDARRRYGGLVRDADAMEMACAALVEAGLIRPRFSRAGERGGRQAKIYEVNPIIRRSA